jgi:hypothetical protein
VGTRACLVVLEKNILSLPGFDARNARLYRLPSPASGIVSVCSLSVCYELFLPNSSFPVTLASPSYMAQGLGYDVVSACRIVKGAMPHRQLLRQTNTAGCRFRRRAWNARVGRCYYRLNHGSGRSYVWVRGCLSRDKPYLFRSRCINNR